jgi:acyl carrier protein
MDILNTITEALIEILDIEKNEITPEAYVVRELGAESIDLLELGVAFNSAFNIEVNDDDIFLRTLRLYVDESGKDGIETAAYLAGKYPFLTEKRIDEILSDLDGGPVLKVKDLVGYMEWAV